MIKYFWKLTVLLLVFGLVLAGCGDPGDGNFNGEKAIPGSTSPSGGTEEPCDCCDDCVGSGVCDCGCGCDADSEGAGSSGGSGTSTGQEPTEPEPESTEPGQTEQETPATCPDCGKTEAECDCCDTCGKTEDQCDCCKICGKKAGDRCGCHKECGKTKDNCKCCDKCGSDNKDTCSCCKICGKKAGDNCGCHKQCGKTKENCDCCKICGAKKVDKCGCHDKCKQKKDDCTCCKFCKEPVCTCPEGTPEDPINTGIKDTPDYDNDRPNGDDLKDALDDGKSVVLNTPNKQDGGTSWNSGSYWQNKTFYLGKDAIIKVISSSSKTLSFIVKYLVIDVEVNVLENGNDLANSDVYIDDRQPTQMDEGKSYVLYKYDVKSPSAYLSFVISPPKQQ